MTPLARFAAAERGALSLFMLVMSILLFAILGLMIDAGRSYVAHTRMQDFVDDVAIAAANELDRRPDAIERARAVIAAELVDAGGGTAEDFAVDRVWFLSGPPESADSRLERADFAHLVTDDPAAATHVLLTAEPRAVDWGLLSFLTLSKAPRGPGEAFSIETWAAATLVQDRDCVAPRLAVCLPVGDDLARLAPGSQMRLVKHRGGRWEPAQYGLPSDLADDAAGSCAALSGAERLECLLAIDAPERACGPRTISFEGDPQETVTVEGRQVARDTVAVHRAFNTRFGLFPGEAAHLAIPGVSIDTNHIARRPFLCDGTVAEVSAETQGPPRAPCLADGSCGSVAPPVTRAELEAYWDKAHGGPLPADPEGRPLATRYAVYLHEIRERLLDPEGGRATGPRAQCHPARAAEDTRANRRLFEIAMVDCAGREGLRQTALRIERYYDVFLTEPVEWGEAFVADFDGVAALEDGSARAMAAGDIPDPDAPEADRGSPARYAPYAAQGMHIAAVANTRRSQGRHMPMLFDSADWTGGDSDLAATDMGNVLIVSEDGDATDPDDNARGGMLIFNFDRPTRVESLVFLDGEERHNTIKLYAEPIDLSDRARYRSPADVDAAHAPDLVLSAPVIGDGKHRTMHVAGHEAYRAAVADGRLPEEGVRALVYHMTGSGALDEIRFSNELTGANRRDEILVEIVREITSADPRIVEYPQLRN